MLEFKKAGYLMGAGSPPNAQGDSVEIDGIYQGHAYLVIDVRDLDGNKLIKLRNPHGNDSKESELDWSDDSPKWTKRLKGLINEEMGADGAFWMGLDDFVYCYRALYVCRIFNDSWKKVGPYTGKWQGESAAGLKNPKGRAELENNPHFGIKVSKACTLFVEVTQNEIEQGRAKNKIFFMVQRNGGKRIEAPATNKMAGMSGPAINSKTISKEINLTADSFPYTFSLMTAIYETGVEGSFSLSMYCNDKSIEVIDDERFDR